MIKLGVMPDVATLVNFDRLNSALRLQYRMMPIDILTLADLAMTESATAIVMI